MERERERGKKLCIAFPILAIVYTVATVGANVFTTLELNLTQASDISIM